MPSGSGRVRYVPDPRMFGQLSRSTEMREFLMEAAQAGANSARSIAPTYSGPTYNPAVSRHGEYKASIYSAVSLQPNGWRAEFGAAAPWALQVEFGTGGGGGRRDSRGRFRSATPRPQTGWSPKWRVLGRALDSLRR
ncbi:hypothetical protein [Streptomyces candidus]|uniref:Uncharacterized protein n=1 Tax=Streptomyces candidus TaxID=67283 RepID=A0A7X0LSP8_9ACTN|nr:hypothetical protein [Streptomyces candidus]MBB6439918.1 hypothetical protein [Streptomyces candidus]GHH58119.1 hypothetical protein GCM10018773_66160 [Streptomyces candidus]